MSFVTATSTSATPSTVLMNAITTELTAHPNWELVHVTTDATYTNHVWKNKGTGNAQGADFYVAFMRLTATIGTAPIIIKAAEGYDPALKLAYRGCASVTVAADATDTSAYGATGYAFSDTRWASNVTLVSPTTARSYQIAVTNSTLLVSSTVAANPVIAGLFDPFWAAANPSQEFPLFVGSLLSSVGGFSRMPGYPGVSVAFGNPPLNSTYETALGTIGTPEAMYGVDAIGARYTIKTGTGGGASGLTRGVLRDILYFPTTSAPVVGDTVNVGSATYVEVFDSGLYGLFVDTSAA